MPDASPHSLTTQSDRGAAAPDSQGGRTSGEGRSPHLDAVTDALAVAVARINDLEHRIYLLEGKHNKEGNE